MSSPIAPRDLKITCIETSLLAIIVPQRMQSTKHSGCFKIALPKSSNP